VSRSVVPTQFQKVVISGENEGHLAKIVLSEMTWEENTIMGNVSDKTTGKPIEGACIKVCDEDFQPISYTFTDVDGNFSLQTKLSPNIRVIAAKRGYQTFSSESMPSVYLEKKALNVELAASPNGGIIFYGNIKDAAQKPIGGVKITIFKSYSLNPYDFTFSNDDGLFLFDNIEPGSYRISFQSQTYNEKVINVEVGKDQSVIALETIYLKRKNMKGTLYGIVTNKEGQPVDNALVVLCNANNVPIQVTHTNEHGVYLFSRLDPGTYYILAK